MQKRRPAAPPPQLPPDQHQHRQQQAGEAQQDSQGGFEIPLSQVPMLQRLPVGRSYPSFVSVVTDAGSDAGRGLPGGAVVPTQNRPAPLPPPPAGPALPFWTSRSPSGGACAAPGPPVPLQQSRSGPAAAPHLPRPLL